MGFQHRPPAERSAIASIAALVKWSQCDRTEGTAPGRAAFMASFEKLVDPDGILEPAERARRADYARRAHFKKMALKSAAARRKAS